MTLTFEAVSKTVGGDPHIHPTSFELQPGSLNVLLGATLSGKTSLIRLMAGLDAPTAGRIRVGNVDVTGMPVRKRNVAVVFQQFVNYPTLSVFENIASPLRAAGVRREELQRRVNEVATLLRIDAFLDRKPNELSGGQQQRLAIARALVKRADLVLLDEPLANLDYKLREELRAELPKMFASSGAILVYATTEPLEALSLGGNTLALDRGRVVQFAATGKVYRSPTNLCAAQVFSDPPLNLLPARKEGAQFRAAGGLNIPTVGPLANCTPGDYVFGFRPNHLLLAPGPGPSIKMDVTVELTEITGSESYIHVNFSSSRWIALAHGIHALARGARLQMYLDPSQLFAFDSSGELVGAPPSS